MQTPLKDRTGQVIAPWWMLTPAIRAQHAYKPWAEIFEREFNPMDVGFVTQEMVAYPIRFRDTESPNESTQWVCREEYCMRALEGLCKNLDWSFYMRWRGKWKIVITCQQFEEAPAMVIHDSREIAVTQMLGQIDSLWRR